MGHVTRAWSAMCFLEAEASSCLQGEGHESTGSRVRWKLSCLCPCILHHLWLNPMGLLKERAIIRNEIYQADKLDLGKEVTALMTHGNIEKWLRDGPYSDSKGDSGIHFLRAWAWCRNLVAGTGLLECGATLRDWQGEKARNLGWAIKMVEARLTHTVLHIVPCIRGWGQSTARVGDKFQGTITLLAKLGSCCDPMLAKKGHLFLICLPRSGPFSH